MSEPNNMLLFLAQTVGNPLDLAAAQAHLLEGFRQSNKALISEWRMDPKRARAEQGLRIHLGRNDRSFRWFSGSKRIDERWL